MGNERPGYLMTLQKRSAKALPIFWTGIVFVLAFRFVEDFDTFWQLQTGKHIWETKGFIYQDTFSRAAEVFRLEHCWLSDLVFYGFYSLGSYSLLNILKPTLIALCGCLLLKWNLRRGVDVAVALPLLTLCLLASEPSWMLRPQLWTFLFSLLYVHLLHRGREVGLRAWLWLAPLMLLWVNLHAGCVFGIAVIGMFGAGEMIRALRGQTAWGKVGQLSLAGLLTVASTFVNPYGYRVAQIFTGNINLHDVSLPTMAGNMEWLPPTFAQVPLFYIVMALWGGLILWRIRRLDPAEGIFFLAFLYMGLSMIRHTTLVALLAGYYLPGAVQETIIPLWRVHAPRFPLPALLRWGTIGLLVGLVGQQARAGNLGLGLKDGRYPAAATDFLQAQKLPVDLYNAYDWGGYLMWRLYPGYLVFLDSRADSLEHFNASNEIDNRGPGWEATLDRYGVNTILTRTCYFDTGEPLALIDGLVRSPRWSLVYQDDVAVIFVRKDERFRSFWEHSGLPSWRAYQTMQAEARRLLREDPDRTKARLALGKASLMLGDFQEAQDHLHKYVKENPADEEASVLLKLTRLKGGRG